MDNGEMVYSQNPLPVADGDVVIVPWFEDDNASAIVGLDAATGGDLERALGTKELSGRPYEMFIAAITVNANRRGTDERAVVVRLS